MSERALATIREVAEVQDIPNADRIQAYRVDGWWVVDRKEAHKVGDKVVYFEIDSFLPVREEFEFLRKSSFRTHPEMGEGFRLKTVKLRKQISQGLLTPLAFPELAPDVEVGMDVTEALGVRKWEPPVSAQLRGSVCGNFPEWFPKTDQDRVQNVRSSEIAEHAPYELTLKLDGTSMSIYATVDGESGVCSRNWDLKLEDDATTYVRVAKDHGLLDTVQRMAAELHADVAIQGELMGPGIQKNREGLTYLKWYVFDIHTRIGDMFTAPVPADQRRRLCDQYGLQHVPVLDDTWQVPAEITPQASEEEKRALRGLCLELADRPSLSHAIAEGVVFKSIRSPEFTFKAINNRFLLKEKD